MLWLRFRASLHARGDVGPSAWDVHSDRSDVGASPELVPVSQHGVGGLLQVSAYLLTTRICSNMHRAGMHNAGRSPNIGRCRCASAVHTLQHLHFCSTFGGNLLCV